MEQSTKNKGLAIDRLDKQYSSILTGTTLYASGSNASSLLRWIKGPEFIQVVEVETENYSLDFQLFEGYFVNVCRIAAKRWEANEGDPWVVRGEEKEAF